jgi:hypothetical protein
MAAGRHVIGNYLNSLAVFIAKVKTTALSASEMKAVRLWISRDVPTFSYRSPVHELSEVIDSQKTKNMSLVKARFIKKAAAAALVSLKNLPSQTAQDFVRCVLLRVSQWALDGRQRHTPLSDYRQKIAVVAEEMLSAIALLSKQVKQSGGSVTICNCDARVLARAPVFEHKRVNLVVTSPPYPGLHVLYHRWQVDGRRETPAPYWIAGCNDGQGASFYNFGGRHQASADTYFDTSLQTLHAIRRVVLDGAYMVQLIAFSRPDDQLPRYLQNMLSAGFSEVSIFAQDRIWRDVPNRKWHARLRGETHSAREVVLVHRAV